MLKESLVRRSYDIDGTQYPSGVSCPETYYTILFTNKTQQLQKDGNRYQL